MSFDKEIEAPYTLASLPHPVDSARGRTLVAGVSSLSGTKKRKRTEAVAGIDGEGILIYGLQNPQLLTSYVLAPQTSFTATPHSLYRKGTSKRPSCRFTYASLTQKGPGVTSQLVCFSEEIQKEPSPVKTSYTLPHSAENVVFIDTIPVSEDLSKNDSHDVLVVSSNGHVFCLSSDLHSLRWTSGLVPQPLSNRAFKYSEDIIIEHVSLTNARLALRGLLKGRDDITTTLKKFSDEKRDILDLTQILCVVGHQQRNQGSKVTQRVLSLFQLAPRSTDIITSLSSPMKHLVTWILPQSSISSTETSSDPSFSLSPAAGMLYELERGVLTCFDLSGLIPKIYSQIEVPESHGGSFVRLSPDLILTSSPGSCQIYEVKYKSIQAMRELEIHPRSPMTSKKRKASDTEPSNSTALTSFKLITYFSELGLAVGISDHELIGIQLVGNVTRKRTRTEGSLLIDSISKGVRFRNSSSYSKNPQRASSDWQKKVAKLDRYASKGKIAEFENIFAEELGIKPYSTDFEDRILGIKIPAKLTNGTSESVVTNGASKEPVTGPQEDPEGSQLQKWQLSQLVPDKQRHLHRHQAIYALGKIFSWANGGNASESKSSIKITFFAPNVFEWLLRSGYLTKESIQNALLQHSPNILHISKSIKDGDIVQSIVEYDPDLHILSAVLNHDSFLPVGEVVEAIQLLIQSLEDKPATVSHTRLLTNGAEPSEGDMDVDFTSEIEAAEHDLDHALAVLDEGVSIRSATLRSALIRLHTFPALLVTSTLRKNVPRHSLESLIRLLHFELKNGGWTSSYDFTDADNSALETSSDDPDDQAIAIIASLLSCALDAIGTSAWLGSVGGSTSEETTEAEDTIHELYDETTLAINGFWEARFMRGLLGEFLRYAHNIARSQKPTSTTLQKQGKPITSDNLLDQGLPLLPLGGKADIGVEKTKMKNGKRLERSVREMGLEISKRVPKYSFERIVI